MGQGIGNRLLKGTRLFVACSTLVLLTATVLHREDHDGYQATHLFFMPRQNWEMDGGHRMLYEEEHYQKMDLQALAAETFGLPAGVLADTPGEGGYQQEHGLSPCSIPDRLFIPSHGPFLEGTPYTHNLDEPGAPVAFAASGSALGPDYLYDAEAPPVRPHVWQGDVRSPPPRDGTLI